MIDGVHTTLTNVDALQINEITIEYITYLYGHSNAQLETCANCLSWPSTLLQSNKGAYHTSKSAVLLICYEVESRKSNINLRGDIIYNVQLAYK